MTAFTAGNEPVRELRTTDASPMMSARLLHLLALPALALCCCLCAAGVTTRGFLWGAAGFAVVLAGQLRLLRMANKAIKSGSVLNEQLLQSRKMAAIGELSSGIAHEINTPLNIIIQEVEWLQHLLTGPLFAEADTREFSDSLEQILTQVRRCSEITHGILNFAKKMHSVEQATDVNQLVGDMLRWVEREGRPRNITFERRLDPALPEISTDAPMLRQVVLNLLNNAAQAVDHDGTVIVGTARDDGKSLRIFVQDNGPGIAPEHLESIFTPFFTTKEPGKGTGLGLSLSQFIVTKLGGRIDVSSEPGKGALFNIILPLKKAGEKETA